MVAPFEADAQLAYLNKEGYADVVITEDSDLLVFGCTQVIFYCCLVNLHYLEQMNVLQIQKYIVS